MNKQTVGLSKAELLVLIEYYKDRQYEYADAEAYEDAAFCKQRKEELRTVYDVKVCDNETFKNSNDIRQGDC